MAEPFIGDGAVVGIAINADNSGTTWGGTPGTEIAVRPYPGTMKWDRSCKQNPVADLRVDEGHNVTGGKSYSGSFEMPASYLGMELFLQALLGGTLTKTGATAPYTWTPALADELLYCRIGYYTQDRAGTAVSRRFTNAAISAITISCNAEEEAKVTVSWVAATLTVGTEAIPTPVALEPILWSHLAPTFNSVTTHQLYSVKLEIAQALSDAEFQMYATTPTVLAYIQRAGQRTCSVEAEFLHDSTTETLADVLTAIVISLIFDNGGTTTAERELNIQLNGGYLEGRSDTDGAWGVKKTTLKWMNRAATAPYAITIKNGDDTIP
jgi:hypothetical protein